MVLKGRQYCPLRNIWKCLVVAARGDDAPAPSEQRLGAASRPTVHGTALHTTDHPAEWQRCCGSETLLYVNRGVLRANDFIFVFMSSLGKNYHDLE